jgi:predicted RNA-binding Zn-ribbon protein involved in translation (DUF1610 family)
METSTGASDAYARANELYWGSDRSVNQIADELDLSKGALYEMIRPLAAGLGCPLCSAEVVHSNRTAKERQRVDCAACGWDGTEDEAIPLEGRARRPAPRAPRPDPSSDEIYAEADFDAPRPPAAFVDDPATRGQRMIVGGALLGAAVGLALVIWARRK